MKTTNAQMTTAPYQGRRGSALLLVLIMVLVLIGIAAALMMAVNSAARESTSIVRYGEALEYAEIAESRSVSNVIQYDPVYNGTEWEGFVEDNLAKGQKDICSVTEFINGKSYSVYVRSAYLAQKNGTVGSGYMAPISVADRGDVSKPLFDIYEFSSITPPIGSEGYQRGIQTVYEIRKLNIPAALYLEKPHVPDWNGLKFVVDGADHEEYTPPPGLDKVIKMPFSGKIDLDYGGTAAGIHSSFNMLDPATGEQKQIFYDGHTPYNDWINDGKTPMVFPEGAELDFWINARAEAWSKGMGEYDHHAFGDQYFDPASAFDGKAFGATWQRIKLKTGVKPATLLPLFQAAYPDLAAKYPKMNLDPNNDGFIGENAEGIGTSTNWTTNNEDFTGDGKVEFEKDVDSNGKMNTWFGNKRNEDLNKDGKVQDADYQLSRAIQEWLTTTQSDQLDHVELRLGFEDLPGWYGSNDWDYDDLVMTLQLVPFGNLKKTNPPAVLDVNYIRSEGIPAVGSTMDYADLGLTSNAQQKQEQQVRSLLKDNTGTVQDVIGEKAYTVQPLNIRAFAANFIGGTSEKLDPKPGVVVYDTPLKINGAGQTDLGTKDNIQLTYVSGDGGTIAGQAEGAGVLVVEGDLHISGQFTFHGTLIVMGNLTISGGGTGVHILGNVMVGGDFAITGNSDIWYCSSAINKVYEQFKPPIGLYAVPLSWKELTKAEIAALTAP